VDVLTGEPRADLISLKRLKWGWSVCEARVF
jgi:hypothetical protein